MSAMDIKVEEYKSLRTSIDMHLKHILQILAFMVAATSALLGYGFSSKEAFVFLTPLLIILSCTYLIRTQMEEVLRKGAYIMIKCEQNYIGWESTLYELRQSPEKEKRCLWQKAATDSKAIVLIALVLILICFTCFSYFMFGCSVCKVFICSISAASFILFSYIIVLRSVLKAYTYEKEENYVKELRKAINDLKKEREDK
jgi:hypothetical protein